MNLDYRNISRLNSTDVAHILGDVAYLSAFLLIIATVILKKSCAGWSGRMHIIIVFIYVSRYWKMLNTHGTIYQITAKSLWIILSLVILYLIYIKFSNTYDRTYDTFWIEVIILPAIPVAFIYCSDVESPAEILWLFSHFVESLSILPQYYMIFHSGQKTFSLTVYIVLLMYYRLFYIGHWWCDYYLFGKLDYFVLVPGIIQIAVYGLYFLIPKGKEPAPNNEPAEAPIEPVRRVPRYLTQESLLETPLLKRSATSASSLYLMGCDSNYSTLTRNKESKNEPSDPQTEPTKRRAPRYLTQESLLETPLLKRSATSASSIYTIGCDSSYSTLSRRGSGGSNDEGRY